MMNDKTKELLAQRQAHLREKIEDVCKWIDNVYTADRYQLLNGYFSTKDYSYERYRATRALNSQLKKLLRKIPNMKVIDREDILAVVMQGMEEVMNNPDYSDCGSDSSEVCWCIEDAVEDLYERL